MKKNNSFGKTLEKLLLTSGVKNYTIARALNYDVSYISKWISAAVLPSKKNVDRVIDIIAETILSQGDPQGLDEVGRRLGISDICDKELLRTAMENKLTEAYFASSGNFPDGKYINNASLTVLPDNQLPLLTDFSKEIDAHGPLHIAVMADLFALDRPSKLLLAGIEHHRFRLKEMRENIHLHLILNLDSLKGNMVYDVVLLIHLLSHYSLTDFQLSYSGNAAGKLIFAVEEEYAGVTFLSERRQYLCTTVTRDSAAVNSLYNSVLMEQDPDKTIFFSTVMDDMLKSHEYIRALLSSGNKWLVGHITEHLLAPEIFERMADNVWPLEQNLKKEARRAHALAVNAAGRGDTEFLIYDTALTNFVLSGEVDFFNHRVILSPEERRQQLIYLRDMMGEIGELQIKMIAGGFSDDFKYITNPCMFLSDAMDYLRLENGCYTNNLLLVKDKSVQEIFHTFFAEIWNHRDDVVLSDREQILQKMENLLNTSNLLLSVE